MDLIDGKYTIELSYDTLSEIIRRMKEESFRGDDPALVSSERILDSMDGIASSDAWITLSYPSYNGVCDYVVSNGRSAPILPAELCTNIKSVLHWRISLLMDTLRSERLDEEGSSISIFQQLFFAANGSTGLNATLTSQAIANVASGNTLLSPSEQSEVNRFSTEILRSREDIAPIIAFQDAERATKIMLLQDELIWEGLYINLSESKDSGFVSWLDSNDLAAWEETNNTNPWQLYQAAVASAYSPNTEVRYQAVRAALRTKKFYSVSEGGKVMEIATPDESKITAAMNGLLLVGYNPIEVDLILASPTEAEILSRR